jgi:hypothetical protein
MTARIARPFSYLECLSRARATFAAPPKWEWTRRVEPRGDLVAQFALPLELCPTSNQRMRGGIKQRFAEAALKKTALKMMKLQLGQGVAMLRGRPLVRAVRFSCQETDATSDWSKIPTDRLIDLGLIYDDAPRYCEHVQWSEYAKRGEGFVYLDVWTGE